MIFGNFLNSSVFKVFHFTIEINWLYWNVIWENLLKLLGTSTTFCKMITIFNAIYRHYLEDRQDLIKVIEHGEKKRHFGEWRCYKALLALSKWLSWPFSDSSVREGVKDPCGEAKGQGRDAERERGDTEREKQERESKGSSSMASAPRLVGGFSLSHYTYDHPHKALGTYVPTCSLFPHLYSAHL